MVANLNEQRINVPAGADSQSNAALSKTEKEWKLKSTIVC